LWTCHLSHLYWNLKLCRFFKVEIAFNFVSLNKLKLIILNNCGNSKTCLRDRLYFGELSVHRSKPGKRCQMRSHFKVWILTTHAPCFRVLLFFQMCFVHFTFLLILSVHLRCCLWVLKTRHKIRRPIQFILF
jgi:hypothetical protein